MKEFIINFDQLMFMHHHVLHHPELLDEFGNIVFNADVSKDSITLTTKGKTDDGCYQVMDITKNY